MAACNILRRTGASFCFRRPPTPQFADGYAQAVTFGLLMARAFDISLNDGVELAAIKLKKTNTLIGTALNVLTEDEANQQSLKTSLGTLTRVLERGELVDAQQGQAGSLALFLSRSFSKSTTTACASSPAPITRRQKSSRR